MPHTLPALPYAFDALEPHIDAQTMQIHHGKHHQAYVTNLNAALDKHQALHNDSLESVLSGLAKVPEDIRAAVRNNGGGHWNHSQFWTWMAPGAAARPPSNWPTRSAVLLATLQFRSSLRLRAPAARLGWAGLIRKDGKLAIVSTRIRITR